MALVPLKQTITVTKAGVTDEWGDVGPGDELTLKARVVEETKIITAASGKEAVTSLHIYLDKLADISYDDTITFTNENGVTVERKPLSIAVKRGFSSKPILTEVFV
ncbi:hypothetical protein [Paenibacillus planticolens]|uniref:Phage protein n=1 Tax=Paenibacillus planticolens TaxID=2654976 RepID=A0ABX1ZF36_9BACL|nr:hypothetical protein [Paenibacillus planticolens]NOU98480.1 hypothetical protein [Paenibacillus planticolens]